MKMLIGGEKVNSSDERVIEVTNPANGVIIDTVPAATEEDIEYAVKQAKIGQKKWSSLSIYERGEILYKFVDLIKRKDNAERIGTLLARESGRTPKDGIGEMLGPVYVFNGFIEKSRHTYGEVYPSGAEMGTERHIQFTVRESVGIVVCIIPFNFPIGIGSAKIAPALIAGNAVIVKPPTDNPLAVISMCELLIEAGVPGGVIQVITGYGSKVGKWLCANPGVGAITLTGSTGVGIEVMKTASQNLIPVSLELGGNDAFILLEDGDVELAADEAIVGRMNNAGQVCAASKRFLIYNSLKEEFVKKVIERLGKIIVGDPSNPKTTMGCLISKKAAIEVEKQVNKTVDQDAKIIYGGKRKGAFYYPTILSDVTPKMDIAKDMEVFGPVIPIIGFSTTEEAIEIANKSIYGLCGGVFSRDVKNAMKVASSLHCGCTVINGSGAFRTNEMPFGGYKKSGIGNEGFSCTLDEVTNLKTVVFKNIIDSSPKKC